MNIAVKDRVQGFTYTCVDAFGVEHRRFSAFHAVPRYSHAILNYLGSSEDPRSPGKAGVQFARNEALARKTCLQTQRAFPCRRVEIVPVSATQGLERRP